jgi:hypothetical protein
MCPHTQDGHMFVWSFINYWDVIKYHFGPNWTRRLLMTLPRTIEIMGDNWIKGVTLAHIQHYVESIGFVHQDEVEDCD